MGEAAMPTENGQGAGKVSMSGGWLLSVGSHATNKQMAFNFITIALDQKNSLFYDIGAGQIATRADVAVGALLQGVQRFDRGVLQLRPLHPLPPRLHRLPQALRRDPGDHRPGHDRPGHPGPGCGDLQQVPRLPRRGEQRRERAGRKSRPPSRGPSRRVLGSVQALSTMYPLNHDQALRRGGLGCLWSA